MSRWQAFAIHIGISIAIFIALLTVILTLWYPGILFSIDGGWTGLRIVIGVDLVLGPLLTLIVFKAGKPGLKFDLTCIGVFQAACLTAGMWIVYSERPLALVLAYDTIYSLAADEFTEFDKDASVLEQFPGSYPKLLYTELPDNDISADIVNIRSQFMGDPLFMQTERYRPIPDTDRAAIFRRDANIRGNVSADIQSQLPEGCLFSRFVSVVTTGYVCLDAESGRLTDFFEEDLVAQGEAAESGSAD